MPMQVEPLDVPCPVRNCSSRVGQLCKRANRLMISADLFYRMRPHPERIKAAKLAAQEKAQK